MIFVQTSVTYQQLAPGIFMEQKELLAVQIEHYCFDIGDYELHCFFAMPLFAVITNPLQTHYFLFVQDANAAQL